MWTPTTRQQHSRPVTRYQTDLTDAEWRVAPHLPKPCATGRPWDWPMREILNGIFYVMRAGCPWRLLPNDLPPWGTIYRWFAASPWGWRRARPARDLPSRARGLSVQSTRRRARQSSTARAPRPRGRRATRLRSRGRARPCPRAHGAYVRLIFLPAARTASGEYPRPRWWRTASASSAVHLPVHPACLRRQRICRGEGHYSHVDRR